MRGNVGGDSALAAEVPSQRPGSDSVQGGRAVLCAPCSVASVRLNWTKHPFGLGAELVFRVSKLIILLFCCPCTKE